MNPIPQQTLELEGLSAYLAAAFESGDAGCSHRGAWPRPRKPKAPPSWPPLPGIPQAELRHAFATGS
jgi:hypothetical protein